MLANFELLWKIQWEGLILSCKLMIILIYRESQVYKNDVIYAPNPKQYFKLKLKKHSNKSYFLAFSFFGLEFSSAYTREKRFRTIIHYISLNNEFLISSIFKSCNRLGKHWFVPVFFSYQSFGIDELMRILDFYIIIDHYSQWVLVINESQQNNFRKLFNFWIQAQNFNNQYEMNQLIIKCHLICHSCQLRRERNVPPITVMLRARVSIL